MKGLFSIVIMWLLWLRESAGSISIPNCRLDCFSDDHDPCIVKNLVTNFSLFNCSVREENIEIIDSVIKGSSENDYFIFTVPGSLKLSNSVISFPDLKITASTFEMSNSVLNASAWINKGQSYHIQKSLIGLSYASAGVVPYGCSSLRKPCQNDPYGFLSQAGGDITMIGDSISLYRGSGASDNISNSLGGGRIRLFLGNLTMVNSSISANGGYYFLQSKNAQENFEGNFKKLTGTGGLISIKASLFSADGNSFLSVQGGDSNADVLPGSGGRIIVTITDGKLPNGLKLKMRGGKSSYSSLQAGPGITWAKEYSKATVIIDGEIDPEEDQKGSIALTPLSVTDLEQVFNLRIKNVANVTFQDYPASNESTGFYEIGTNIDMQENSGLHIYNETLGQRGVLFKSELTMEKNAVLSGSVIILSDSLPLQISNEARVEMNDEIIMTGRRNFSVSGSFHSQKDILIKAEDSVQVSGNLKAENKIYMFAKKGLGLSGQITTTQMVCISGYKPINYISWLNFSSIGQKDTIEVSGTDWPGFNNDSSSILVLADDVTLDQGLNLSSGFVSVYGNKITVDGKISASGMGCGSGLEPILNGAGKYNSLIGYCGASGGAYGGIGGLESMPIQEECSALKPRKYGSSTLETLASGSGGGTASEMIGEGLFGSGGGIVVLWANQILKISGNVTSNGAEGGPKTAKIGGGAGGSIFLKSQNVSFKDTQASKGEIKAEGGPGVESCGGGGGGRIFISSINITGTKFKISSSYGRTTDLDGIVGTNGSIVSEYCPPGKTGITCSKCPDGTYKSEWGPQRCIPCHLAEKQNQFLSDDDSKNILVCKPPNNSVIFLITQMVPFMVALVVVLVLIFLFAFFYKKYSRFRKVANIILRRRLYPSDFPGDGFEERRNSQETPMQKLYSLSFEEVPQHFARIYIKGLNSARAPWVFNYKDIGFSEVLKYIDKETFQNFEKKFNAAAKWPKWMVWILFFTKIINYSPGYMLLVRFWKGQIFKRVCSVINEDLKFTERARSTENLQIRITVSENQSLLCLDFVNKNIDTMNWSIVKNLPIVFRVVGQGTFNNPFRIDLRDPYLQTLISHFNILILRKKVQAKLMAQIMLKKEQKQVQVFQMVALLLNVYLRSLLVTSRRKTFQMAFVEFGKYLVLINEQIFGQTNYMLTLRYEKTWKNLEESTVQMNLDYHDQNRFIDSVTDLYYTLNFSKDSYASLQIVFNQSTQLAVSPSKVIRAFGEDLIEGNQPAAFAIPHHRSVLETNKSKLSPQPTAIPKFSIEFPSSPMVMEVRGSVVYNGITWSYPSSMPLNPVQRIRYNHLISCSMLDQTKKASVDEVTFKSPVAQKPKLIVWVLSYVFFQILSQVRYKVNIHQKKIVKNLLLFFVFLDVVSSHLIQYPPDNGDLLG